MAQVPAGPARANHQRKPDVDWPSDFWIAKTQSAYSSMFHPVWSFPEEVDQWPTLDLPSGSFDARWPSWRTNSESLAGLLGGQRSDRGPGRRGCRAALLRSRPVEHQARDQAMIRANQFRTWVTTAFVDVLTGIAFTPTDDPDVFVAAVAAVQALVALVDVLPHEQRRHSWMDFGCDTLCNLAITADGVQPSGLGLPYRRSSGWVSHQAVKRPPCPTEMGRTGAVGLVAICPNRKICGARASMSLNATVPAAVDAMNLHSPNRMLAGENISVLSARAPTVLGVRPRCGEFPTAVGPSLHARRGSHRADRTSRRCDAQPAWGDPTR
jgi:hypothetical protein